LIARARLVLNIHSYQVKVLEIVRISFLLANGKAVVSECDAETEVPQGIEQVVALAPYGQLADLCQQLLADEPRRQAMERDGLEWMRARPAAHFLAAQVERRSRAAPAPTPPRPRILHFSRALLRSDSVLYLDDASALEVDIPYDYHRPLPIGQPLNTERFGVLRLEHNSFDEIVVGDNLSWVSDLPRFMLDCALLLRAGGRLLLRVPYQLAERAWENPRTVRSFTLSTWQIFQDAHVRMGWPGIALDPDGVQLQLSASGLGLQQKGLALDELLTTPRAVDTLLVNFTKRALRPLPV
jgi:SAM-dependent methyltransferase